MGAIDTSYTFTATDVITSAKMNNILDQSTITANAIIGTTLAVASGKLSIAAGGIRANELAANAVTTTAILDANVTPAKLSNSDFGDFTVASGVATIDAGVVTFAKIATAAVGTVAEVKAETASKLVTADIAKHLPGVAKAYGSVATAVGTRTLTGGYNAGTPTKISANSTQVIFTGNMANNTYVVTIGADNTSASSVDRNYSVYDKQATGFKVYHEDESSVRGFGFSVFGTLA
jgi:hypothetical protein